MKKTSRRSKRRIQLTIPNLITAIRLLIVPVLVLVFYFDFHEWQNGICALLFLSVGITDWLDGYLARKLHQMTEFGAFVDPVVDKLTVAVALILLIKYYPGALFVVPSLVIISREILVSALREWMAGDKKQTIVAVSGWGKWKTAMQMVAISGFFLSQAPIGELRNTLSVISYITLYVAMGLTLISMWRYFYVSFQAIKKSI